jgi:phage-related baseplate assembly protein
MPFTPITPAAFLANWLGAYRANTNTNFNLKPGAIALALGQADVQQAVTLQFIAQNVINFARATTSTGADLDSWMAQFSFPRLPAVFATGLATWSASPLNPQTIYIPVGTQVQTPGGAITYSVIADLANPNYSAQNNAYILPPQTASITVTMQAVVAGTSYNIQAGQLTVPLTSVFGITGVTNTLPIVDGEDQESDASYRARFVDFIDSLSKATHDAILAAVEGVQSGLKVQLFENVIAVGNPPTSFITASVENYYAYGNFVVLVDDGSGAPSSALLNQIFNALFGNVRAYTVRYQVLPSATINPQIVIPVRLLPGANPDTVNPIIQAAIIAFGNAQAIGGTNPGWLYAGEMVDVAFNATPIVSVELNGVTINGVNADFVIQPFQELMLTASNVTVTNY